jgi:hypothetical protein
VCAFGLLLSFASAEETSVETLRQEGLQRTNLTRFVPSGVDRTVEFLYGANPDCSPMDGSIEVRTTREPEHGAVEIVPSDNFPNFARDNIRFKCNEKRIRGVSVKYKSSEGHIGPDEFEVLVLYPGGYGRAVHFNIHVR